MSDFSKWYCNYFLVVFLIINLQLTWSQNLVKNPSFEDFVVCPETYSTFQEDVLFWTNPTSGSTDYFNDCSDNMKAYRNFSGIQESFHGIAYAGIYAYGPKDYREYIQGELKEKLKKDKRYSVSAMISLSEKSEFAVNEFGFLLTDQELNLQIKRNIPHSLMVREGNSRYVRVVQRDYYSDKDDWVEVKVEYIANGTERYLSFGNFKSNSQTRRISTGSNLKQVAYYYVDLLKVEEMDGDFMNDEIYVFEGLNFDVDGYNIKDQGVERLKPILNHLKENPTLNIVIYGHTDNAGNAEYNKVLSEKRAKSVGLFLVNNGLSPFRIAWQGYGKSKPVLPNETKKGREKNRRVEFILSKKKREYYATGLFEDEDND
jgi:outer membrane protein OmpA-like peptidoglycan-associated protein